MCIHHEVLLLLEGLRGQRAYLIPFSFHPCNQEFLEWFYILYVCMPGVLYVCMPGMCFAGERCGCGFVCILMNGRF